jgi:hypothetical protein
MDPVSTFAAARQAAISLTRAGRSARPMAECRIGSLVECWIGEAAWVLLGVFERRLPLSESKLKTQNHKGERRLARHG